MIVMMNLVAAQPHLQHMLFWFQPYNVTIQNRSGKEMLLADALSHLPSPIKITIEMDMCIDHHGFTTDRIKQLKQETTADPTLALAYNFTLNGWPDSRRCMPHTAHKHWDQRDEQSPDQEIQTKGPRIVIPTSQRVAFLSLVCIRMVGSCWQSSLRYYPV